MSMARALIPIIIIAALVATGAVAVLTQLRQGTPRALTPDENMDLLSIPDFRLTDQNGDELTRHALIGEITVLDFFFSNCPFICPPMSRNMKRAQDALADTGVRFLSISVDPEHDSPERLAEYAKEIGADTNRWTFATGDRDEVSRILRDGLLLAAPAENPNQPIRLSDGGEMSNISHPSHFIFVGPDASIISLTNGLDQNEVDRLIERARAAWNELN